MKQVCLSLAGIAAVGLVSHLTPAIAQLQPPFQLAQDAEPASARSVIGTISPDEPILIRLVNESNFNVVSALSEPGYTRRDVPPQAEVTFGTLHTSFLPPPISLSMYSEDDEVSLLVEVTTPETSNEIVVTIDVVPGRVTSIARSLRVDDDGSIYLY